MKPRIYVNVIFCFFFYIGSLSASEVMTSLPYGNVTALQALGLLPVYDDPGHNISADTDIKWSGEGGERGEIGLLPEDHAAFLAGRVELLPEILQAASQPPPSSFSFGHAPNLYWLPYLMTGDAKYLDHMEVYYRIFCNQMNKPYDNWVSWQQAGRYLAWPLRQLVQLAYLEKRGLTKNSYYLAALENAKNNFLNNAMSGKPENKHHDVWRVLVFNSVTYDSFGWTGWMESMVGQVINYAVQLGFNDWFPIAEWQFEHLNRRMNLWSIKAVDNDHVFFANRAPSGAITDYASGRAWAASNGWDKVTEYPKYKMDMPTYSGWDKNSLFAADSKIDGMFYTYHNRAQYAYAWAALAAKNRIPGAAEIANTLRSKVNDRGDQWDFKNYQSGYPFSTDSRLKVNSGTWKPVRNENGLVEKNSWLGLPISSLDNPQILKIDKLNPVSDITNLLKDRGFDTSKMYGYSRVKGTFTAWVGQAFDRAANIAYYPWGGGHADSSINGIWKFNIDKLKFDIESMPSNPNRVGAQWSANYKNRGGDGTFTTYMDDAGEIHFSLPDGRPPSQHTYGGVVKIGDLLFTTRNRKYSYNLKTKEYKIENWIKNESLFMTSIQNSVFSYRDQAFGILKSELQYFGWNKLESSQSVVIEDISSPPNGINFVGQHLVLQMDDTRLMAINFDAQSSRSVYAIFDMETESWGDLVETYGLPEHNYTQEMQAGVYIPSWGSKGSVLREFSYGSLRGQWYVLDLATSQYTPFSFTGYKIQAGTFVGNKAFIADVGGIKALFYLAVNSKVSEVYVMRIQ